jgi:hypothetical protein
MPDSISLTREIVIIGPYLGKVVEHAIGKALTVFSPFRGARNYRHGSVEYLDVPPGCDLDNLPAGVSD